MDGQVCAQTYRDGSELATPTNTSPTAASETRCRSPDLQSETMSAAGPRKHQTATYWLAALSGVPLVAVGVFAVMLGMIGAPLLWLIWTPVAVVWALSLHRFDLYMKQQLRAQYFRDRGPDIECIP